MLYWNLMKTFIFSIIILFLKIEAGKGPDFIIIGTQKGGTTTLYRNLVKHPHILKATCKELHCFDLNHPRNKLYKNDIEWYLDQFPVKESHQITGEASPIYIFDPTTPELVHHYFPNVKLIVLLRNPVDRGIISISNG